MEKPESPRPVVITYDDDVIAQQPQQQTPMRRYKLMNPTADSMLYRRCKRLLRDAIILVENIAEFCERLPDSAAKRTAMEIGDDVCEFSERLGDAVDRLRFSIHVNTDGVSNNYFCKTAIVLEAPIRARASYNVLKMYLENQAYPVLRRTIGRHYGFEI